MKLLSVNVGLSREVNWQRKLVTTGIFKEPVQGPVMMRRLNLDGDQQADLTVHGGVNKAFISIHRNTTAIGEANCLEWICPGECLEKTLPPRDYWRMPFTSGTGFESAKRRSWSRNHECPATN